MRQRCTSHQLIAMLGSAAAAAVAVPLACALSSECLATGRRAPAPVPCTMFSPPRCSDHWPPPPPQRRSALWPLPWLWQLQHRSFHVVVQPAPVLGPAVAAAAAAAACSLTAASTFAAPVILPSFVFRPQRCSGRRRPPPLQRQPAP